MAEPVKSTLRRPSAKELRSFHVGLIKRSDTVRKYLESGWSLAIFCKGCPRVIEWTPAELLKRFGDKLELRIADLAPRLSCKGDGGCGHREVAVGPHRYEGEWIWPMDGV